MKIGKKITSHYSKQQLTNNAIKNRTNLIKLLSLKPMSAREKIALTKTKKLFDQIAKKDSPKDHDFIQNTFDYLHKITALAQQGKLSLKEAKKQLTRIQYDGKGTDGISWRYSVFLNQKKLLDIKNDTQRQIFILLSASCEIQVQFAQQNFITPENIAEEHLIAISEQISKYPALHSLFTQEELNAAFPYYFIKHVLAINPKDSWGKESYANTNKQIKKRVEQLNGIYQGKYHESLNIRALPRKLDKKEAAQQKQSFLAEKIIEIIRETRKTASRSGKIEIPLANIYTIAKEIIKYDFVVLLLTSKTKRYGAKEQWLLIKDINDKLKNPDALQKELAKANAGLESLYKEIKQPSDK